MERDRQHDDMQRSLALGRSGDPAGLDELCRLCGSPSDEVRRLAALGIGLLAGFGANPVQAVIALAPLALRDPHPQVRQSALQSLKVFGAAGHAQLADLRDLAADPRVMNDVRAAAHSAAEAIQASVSAAEDAARNCCLKCGRRVAPERSGKACQHANCGHCFDEELSRMRRI